MLNQNAFLEDSSGIYVWEPAPRVLVCLPEDVPHGWMCKALKMLPVVLMCGICHWFVDEKNSEAMVQVNHQFSNAFAQFCFLVRTTMAIYH